MVEFIKLLEIIGTIAFSISGAIIACGAGLDIFGVVFVGCITAFGGGIFRDIILGINPPTVFSNGIIVLIAMLAAVAIFIIAYVNKNRFNLLMSKIEHINNIFDAVGLAVFSITGAEVGFVAGCSQNILVIVVAGMITGIGGGIMRDVLIDTTPYVFKKHIYALASIFGSLLYFILKNNCCEIFVSSILSILSVIAIRMLATKYRWSLPRIIKLSDVENVNSTIRKAQL